MILEQRIYIKFKTLDTQLNFRNVDSLCVSGWLPGPGDMGCILLQVATCNSSTSRERAVSEVHSNVLALIQLILMR